MIKDFRIDIMRIPFSRYGAYVSVTESEEKNELIIHNVRKRFGQDDAYRLRFQKEGRDVAFQVYAKAWCAFVTAEEGSARIYIRDDKTVVVDSEGLDLVFEQISPNGYGVQEDEQAFKMISVTQSIYYYFYLQKGTGRLSALNHHSHCEQRLTVTEEKNGGCTAALTMSIVEPRSVTLPIEVEKEAEEIEEEWKAFLKKLPDYETVTEEFVLVTWYNLWSSFVRAEDVYHYDTMLMSKKFMCSVWSWDHCFNALAMAHMDQKTALHQFLAPFVLQSPSGALPDMWNPNYEIAWGVTKPPVHGWCFSKLMDHFAFEPEILEAVYGYLEKWTSWWMDYRDSDHDGIPEYPQGCDSGWDNGTIFDLGGFMETPDLPAFLILQMQTLERIADTLSKSQADVKEEWRGRAESWKDSARKLKERFYEHSWEGDHFAAKQSRTHAQEKHTTCLLGWIPLILGEQLEEEKKEKLVASLKTNFLTEYGLATEAPASDRYESDGYWRGPIWAPPTYLIIDGLRRAGESELAKEIAERFCRMASQTAKGNYENYDALTGKGLRAPGYTWTASVYMLLHWEYGI